MRSRVFLQLAPGPRVSLSAFGAIIGFWINPSRASNALWAGRVRGEIELTPLPAPTDTRQHPPTHLRVPEHASRYRFRGTTDSRRQQNSCTAQWRWPAGERG